MNFLMTGSYSAADSLGSEKSYFEAQTAGQVSEKNVDTKREINCSDVSSRETALPTATSAQSRSSNTSAEGSSQPTLGRGGRSLDFLLTLLYYMLML